MAVQRDDVAAVGRAIYDEKIRHKVEPAEKGKVVVIDVNSSDYEIDVDDAVALFRLLERRPDAITWAERIGHPTMYSMGFRGTYPHFESDFKLLKHD